MRVNYQSFRTLLLLIGCLNLITGCATSDSKLAAFKRASSDKGFIYGQVNSITPGIDSAKLCAEYLKSGTRNEGQDYVCPRLNEFKIAYISLVKNTELITTNEAIPITVQLERGSIVKLDASKSPLIRFVEVMAIRPTESCKWTGSDNGLAYDPAKKAVSVVGGFVAGALLLPAAVFYTTDRQGGVDCENWSYKNAFADFLR